MPSKLIHDACTAKMPYCMGGGGGGGGEPLDDKGF